jgi:hypothetical protein
LFLYKPYLEIGMETPMPLRTFTLMLIAVIIAAGITVWGVSRGGASFMAIALPAFMIAALALRVLRK